MITTLIVDDDQSNLDLLQHIVSTFCPTLKLIGIVSNVDDALEKIIKLKPQLLFLDIELHNKSAFDILKVIRNQDIIVVLITAYEKYAIEAFKYDVLGYLLKPISIDELILCVARVEKKLELQNASSSTGGHLSLYTRNNVELIPYKDIIYMESDNSYTYIFLISNKRLISSRSIKETEAELPKKDFIRVHRSYIVNKQHIVSFIRNKHGSLLLSNQKEIPISQQHTAQVKKMLNL